MDSLGGASPISSSSIELVQSLVNFYLYMFRLPSAGCSFTAPAFIIHTPVSCPTACSLSRARYATNSDGSPRVSKIPKYILGGSRLSGSTRYIFYKFLNFLLMVLPSFLGNYPKGGGGGRSRFLPKFLSQSANFHHFGQSYLFPDQFFILWFSEIVLSC